jgi:hypothetical protein
MARKPSSGAGKRPVVIVVEKRRDPIRGGDGHKLGGRPHAADARRDLGRDPFKSDTRKKGD